jgi:uncharacterized protein
MISKNEIKNIIESYKPEKTIYRSYYVNDIFQYINRKEIIVLKGIRRCGKSTIMHQLMKKIGADCVYVNLDDYRLLEYLSIELLEKILQMYLGKKKVYLFLDEIQQIDKFESFLRTHYDLRNNVKFIISGSNSTLMTKELGTLLTGRCLTFEIMPVSFKEFGDFSQGGINEYLKFGGFPEVILEKDEMKKRVILANYFDTVVSKDMIQKYDLVNHKQLREMLKYIMLNPGIRISANKLSKQLGMSINTVKSYLQLAEEVYLIFEVPFFSYSAKTKFIGSRVSKYYSIDNGFFTLFSSRHELSKVYENSVALSFFRDRKDLYYWFDKYEVDFVIHDTAINVVSSKNIPEREYRGLDEIKTKKSFLVASFDDETKGIILLSNFLKNT